MSKWIPIKTRPMDDEERKEWSDRWGYDLEDDEAVMYVSQLPDDGQEVLICVKRPKEKRGYLNQKRNSKSFG